MEPSPAKKRRVTAAAPALLDAAGAGDIHGCIDAIFAGGGLDRDDEDAAGSVGDALWRAAGAGAGDPVRCTKLLLIAGAAVGHTSGDYDSTALHQAGSQGNAKGAETLLCKGGDPEATDSDGLTPLHHAADGPRQGHTATAQALLLMGANLEARDDNGLTPLHWAADKGHTATVEALLSQGADLAAMTNCGWTPLHWASDQGKTATAMALLSKGANPDAKVRPFVCPAIPHLPRRPPPVADYTFTV